MSYDGPIPDKFTKNLPVSFQIDDYPVDWEHGIRHLDKLFSHIPNFKCTVFAIPDLMAKNPDTWAPLIERREWIHVGIHGYRHAKHECRVKFGTEEDHEIRVRRILSSGPWSRIAKAPWYAEGWKYVEGCRRNECPVCVHTRERADELSSFMAKKLKLLLIEGSSTCVSSTRHFGTRSCTSIARGMERLMAVVAVSPGMVFCEDFAEWVGTDAEIKINIGCWDHVLPGWVNFDKHHLALGVRQWEWNKEIPYADGVVKMALIQHVLMYCDKSMYLINLKEIWRAMSHGGILIVKEDDNRNFVWRKLGTNHKTGTVMSTSNPPEMRGLLEQAGFVMEDGDPVRIISKYGDVINRQRKLVKGICYALVARKP